MHYQPTENCLEQRIILVTGASDGIGREAAITYARHGASVILVGRNESKLRAVAESIHQQGLPEADVLLLDYASATADDCRELADRLAKKISHLDGILHNAGILGDLGPMAEQDPTTWEAVMQVNVNVTFFLTQALLPLLLNATRPSLVFTSSSVGKQGRADWGAYAVSKFATEGMMQVLADEYREQNLRVNCVNPGGTRTAMRAKAFPTEDPNKLKTPTDLMPLYVWLMADDSHHQSGISFDAQPQRKPGIAQ
ncbi:YciK family oxidoreductase [Citrobacter sp. JGM124]|uniref:YciK family oxidoreductase n=1 Tax=Citrobacter sp. JGM124 TaxID=2799789 RepID=UPI001BA6FC17|nr:YciK family oxidoreductase [Citrobacter sp. JGM124]MBS0847225.1 YciK family oxidoreductase [Citrobacter sp. JGM124]